MSVTPVARNPWADHPITVDLNNLDYGGWNAIKRLPNPSVNSRLLNRNGYCCLGLLCMSVFFSDKQLLDVAMPVGITTSYPPTPEQTELITRLNTQLDRQDTAIINRDVLESRSLADTCTAANALAAINDSNKEGLTIPQKVALLNWIAAPIHITFTYQEPPCPSSLA